LCQDLRGLKQSDKRVGKTRVLEKMQALKALDARNAPILGGFWL